MCAGHHERGVPGQEPACCSALAVGGEEHQSVPEPPSGQGDEQGAPVLDLPKQAVRDMAHGAEREDDVVRGPVGMSAQTVARDQGRCVPGLGKGPAGALGDGGVGLDRCGAAPARDLAHVGGRQPRTGADDQDPVAGRDPGLLDHPQDQPGEGRGRCRRAAGDRRGCVLREYAIDLRDPRRVPVGEAQPLLGRDVGAPSRRPHGDARRVARQVDRATEEHLARYGPGRAEHVRVVQQALVDELLDEATAQGCGLLGCHAGAPFWRMSASALAMARIVGSSTNAH